MKIRRFGQIGKLKREKIEEYRSLHANPWQGVLDVISECNLKNYTIFLQGDLVFAYFEYVGGDYDADMKKMDADELTQKWWSHTKPCFEKFAIASGSEFFHDMTEIFHLA